MAKLGDLYREQVKNHRNSVAEKFAGFLEGCKVTINDCVKNNQEIPTFEFPDYFDFIENEDTFEIEVMTPDCEVPWANFNAWLKSENFRGVDVDENDCTFMVG